MPVPGSLLGGCLVPGGLVSQHALRQTPGKMATVAGGTHPTGMHSCLSILSFSIIDSHCATKTSSELSFAFSTSISMLGCITFLEMAHHSSNTTIGIPPAESLQTVRDIWSVIMGGSSYFQVLRDISEDSFALMIISLSDDVS